MSTGESSNASRRAVLTAAAGSAVWAAPVIIAASAAPASAASSTPPAGVRFVPSSLAAYQQSGRKVGGQFSLFLQSPGRVSIATVTLNLYRGNQLVETITFGPTNVATTWNAVPFTFATVLTPGEKFHVTGSISGTLQAYHDEQNNSIVSGTWSLPVAQFPPTGESTMGNW